MVIVSKGSAGVSGAAFVALAASLASTNVLPIAGLALVLGVDRFMSEARALVNVIGCFVATIVVARWEGQLDMERARAVLADHENYDSPAVLVVDATDGKMITAAAAA